MFLTVTFPDVALSNLNFWPGTPLPEKTLGVFSISGESLEFYNQDLFKQTNKHSDSDGADLIEFVRCGRNM